MVFVVLVTLLALNAGAGPAHGHGCRHHLSGDLTIFHAGSLSIPFKRISDDFMAIHPEVNVQLEAAGSRTCARKISDLDRSCDVMASADYAVIDALLIPDHADWNIHFVSNEMVIAYRDNAPYSAEFNVDTWYDILLRGDVTFGRSDPDSDPCGYRSVLTSKLAESYYDKPGLAGMILAKDTRYIRPKETDLIALYETDTIDYFFIYRSIAEQHEMKYLLLPDRINLKSPEYADFYQTASVILSGGIPGETMVRRGDPMVYGVTIPKSSRNPEAALAFVEYLLNSEYGIKVMERYGQPSVVPAGTSSYNKIPKALKVYAREEKGHRKPAGIIDRIGE